MDFELDAPARQAQEEARALAAAVEPMAVEADAMSTLHDGVHKAFRESGLATLTVPAAYGGRHAEVDPVVVCVAREQLMAVSSHLDTMFAMQGIGSYALARAGTDEQRAHWLPRVASGEVLAALAVTEPEAGSDLKGLSTTITDEGGSVVVNGTKSFISNAGAAGYYTVLGREADGYSLVLVPADADGVTVEPERELIAPHILGDGALRGHAAGRVGAHRRGGQGLRSRALDARGLPRLGGGGVGRSRVAGAAGGDAPRQQRVQFGRPLARLGPVAALLADSWADVEMTRLLAYRSAYRAREDPLGNLHHSSMAKLAATEAASRVVDRCVQVMGRWGLIRDSEIERLYRAARPMRIYEGASEVLRLGIAKALTDEVA